MIKKFILFNKLKDENNQLVSISYIPIIADFWKIKYTPDAFNITHRYLNYESFRPEYYYCFKKIIKILPCTIYPKNKTYYP